MSTTERKNEDVEYIKDHIPFEDLCNCLAEEASELASAASKLLRVERGINPCAKSKEEVINNLMEEYTDTLLIAKDILGLCEDEQRKERKISQWRNNIELRSIDGYSGHRTDPNPCDKCLKGILDESKYFCCRERTKIRE